MSEVVVVIIFAVTLVGGVLAYSFFSTSLGYEEDVNKNYIPDWIERIFVKDFDNKNKNDSEDTSNKKTDQK
jgi:hypothetical protein|tara:strand:+ start:16 stop:228 length:213 start_codon:yes stop_codon:yes gene_type:complete